MYPSVRGNGVGREHGELVPVMVLVFLGLTSALGNAYARVNVGKRRAAIGCVPGFVRPPSATLFLPRPRRVGEARARPTLAAIRYILNEA